MSNKKKELEELSLAALLVTISAISVPSLAIFQNTGKETLANDIFLIVGLLSIYGAARIIDDLLDNSKIDKSGGIEIVSRNNGANEPGVSFWERLKLFGRGYMVFCIVVSLISYGLLVLYANQENLNIQQEYLSTVLNALYSFTGVSIFFKLMTDDEPGIWGFLVSAGLVLSISSTILLSRFSDFL